MQVNQTNNDDLLSPIKSNKNFLKNTTLISLGKNLKTFLKVLHFEH